MVRGISIAAILVLYAAACALPAMGKPGDPNSVSLPGYMCLTYPLAFIIPLWWANPLLGLGCVALAFGWVRTGLGLGIVAAILGIGYFGYGLTDDGTRLMVGAYFWLASLIALPAASFYFWKLAPTHPSSSEVVPSVSS